MALEQHQVPALDITRAYPCIISPDALINSYLFGGFRTEFSARGTSSIKAWSLEAGTSERLNIRDRVFQDFILTLTQGVELIVRFKSSPVLFNLVFAGGKLENCSAIFV